MRVFILFHADIEDDRYVRGVYSTRTAAEGDIAADEWSSAGGGREYRRRHHEFCCSVDEVEVLDASEPRRYGPFVDELRDPNAVGLFRSDIVERLLEQYMAPSPLFDLVRGAKGPIGHVTSVVEDAEGVKVEGILYGRPGALGDEPR